MVSPFNFASTRKTYNGLSETSEKKESGEQDLFRFDGGGEIDSDAERLEDGEVIMKKTPEFRLRATVHLCLTVIVESNRLINYIE